MAHMMRLRLCGSHKSFSRGCGLNYSVERLFSSKELKPKYDAVIIGAGHNGLVSAAYLQKQGLDVCVLEKRHIIGGAAVTEEIIPGFRFSRASYLLSLLRPQIYNDLELKRHGLRFFLRDPNSYTPLLEPKGSARSLLLGRDEQKNKQQIGQFSSKDADAFPKYEKHLDEMITSLDKLLDSSPVHLDTWNNGSLSQKYRNWPSLYALIKSGQGMGQHTSAFYELMTAPASKVLDKWFESEPLKATLATDSVIGAMTSPQLPGSGYVLLHHVMGELDGVKGAWGYVEGGMGGVSQAIANCALENGASIFTECPVKEILTDSENRVCGVSLEGGTEVHADLVLSNATAKVTFLDLITEGKLPSTFVQDIQTIDYTSPVTKINVAVNKLPSFIADPNNQENQPLPHHQSTIHMNCEDSQLIHDAYLEATQGKFSKHAVIEMTIPSSVDGTVAPPGCHVVQLFTQYTPYTLSGGKEWDEETKNQYADSVFDDIENYAPGFKQSVIGRDVLTPPDIERVFGLTGGNIFQGSMSLDQLYMARPTPAYSDYRSPIKGLYLCGSGAHPGGGVMGSPGRLAAEAVLSDRK